MNHFIFGRIINDIKRIHNLPGYCCAWYQLDGKEIQIRCFEDPQMLQFLEDNLILWGAVRVDYVYQTTI